MVEYVSKKNNKRTSYYKIYNKTGGASVRISKSEFLKKTGGDIDITKQWSGPNDSAPEPMLNGGLYTGEKFDGPWGNYPVPPTANGFIANLASANPPPGAMDQMPGYIRLGNNFQVNPTQEYSGDTLIKCTAGGAKKNKSTSKKYNKKGGNMLETVKTFLLGGQEGVQEEKGVQEGNEVKKQNSTVPNSTVTNSTVPNSTVQNSTASNSTAPNSTASNSTQLPSPPLPQEPQEPKVPPQEQQSQMVGGKSKKNKSTAKKSPKKTVNKYKAASYL